MRYLTHNTLSLSLVGFFSTSLSPPKPIPFILSHDLILITLRTHNFAKLREASLLHCSRFSLPPWKGLVPLLPATMITSHWDTLPKVPFFFVILFYSVLFLLPHRFYLVFLRACCNRFVLFCVLWFCLCM